MKLDVSDITEGSQAALEKSHRAVKNKITAQIGFLFDVIISQIDGEVGIEIQAIIDKLLNDEFSKHSGSYMITMDKVRSLIENGLV